jgi:4-hydroxy-4-methyl-2-oxoglutarate aldolase
MTDLATRFRNLYTGVVADVLDGRGYRHQVLPRRIAPMASDLKIAGPAFPGRGEPTDDPTDDDSERRLAMLESVPSGSVSVWDCGGHEGAAHWGEIMSRAVMERGCIGAVVDGGLRDSGFVADIGFPVFCAFRSAASSVGRWNIVDWNHEITVGSTRVRPGDWVFGDVDGVVVVPAELVEEVLAEAEERADAEAQMRAELAAGALPSEVYARLGSF